MSAFDGREPPRSSSVTVTVSVIRDESVPEFIDTPFTATVSENTVVNTVIFTIVAQDLDLQVRQTHMPQRMVLLYCTFTTVQFKLRILLLNSS